jgi:hypothetical protein
LKKACVKFICPDCHGENNDHDKCIERNEGKDTTDCDCQHRD